MGQPRGEATSKVTLSVQFLKHCGSLLISNFVIAANIQMKKK